MTQQIFMSRVHIININISDHFRDGRPGAQAVDTRWRVDWLTYMASSHSYVVIRSVRIRMI